MDHLGFRDSNIFKMITFFFFFFSFFFFKYFETNRKNKKLGGKTPTIAKDGGRVFTAYNRNRRKRKRRIGNPTKKNFGCGPTCHMVGTEVCTYRDFVSFPRGRGCDGANCVQDERGNPPILSDRRIM
jgi:hypothetical protein